MTERTYIHRRTGQVVKLTGFKPGKDRGRASTLYTVEYPNGTRADYVSRVFHQLFERVESVEEEKP